MLVPLTVSVWRFNIRFKKRDIKEWKKLFSFHRICCTHIRKNPPLSESLSSPLSLSLRTRTPPYPPSPPGPFFQWPFIFSIRNHQLTMSSEVNRTWVVQLVVIKKIVYIIQVSSPYVCTDIYIYIYIYIYVHIYVQWTFTHTLCDGYKPNV